MREVESVKAGMGLGQIFDINIHQVKSEQSWTCSTSGALQGLEPLQRDPGGTRHELQQPRSHLLVVPRHDPPEPDDLRGLGRTMLQSGVALPVLEINRSKAYNDQFEFSLVKRFHQMLGNQFIETFLQSQKLLLNSLHKSKIYIQLHIFFLVLFCDWNVFPILFQLMDLNDSKAVVFHTEGGVNDVCDAVLQHLVERHSEASINVMSMEQGNTHNSTNKMK